MAVKITRKDDNYYPCAEVVCGVSTNTTRYGEYRAYECAVVYRHREDPTGRKCWYYCNAADENGVCHLNEYMDVYFDAQQALEDWSAEEASWAGC